MARFIFTLMACVGQIILSFVIPFSQMPDSVAFVAMVCVWLSAGVLGSATGKAFVEMTYGRR